MRQWTRSLMRLRMLIWLGFWPMACASSGSVPTECPDLSFAEQTELISRCEIVCKKWEGMLKKQCVELDWTECPELEHWFTRYYQHCAADAVLRRKQ